MKLLADRRFRFAVALIVLAPLVGVAFTHAQRADSAILSPLRPSKSIEGCGCYLYSDRSERPTTLAYFDDFAESGPILNVDGRNVLFRAVGGSDPQKWETRLGATFEWHLQAAGTRVSLRCRVTRACAEGDEKCESTGIEAAVTVNSGGRRQRLNLYGGCGC